MLGQYGHFTRSPEKIEYAINRYFNEGKRLLGVLEKQLEGKKYVCGEYSIADMAIYPWLSFLPRMSPWKDFLATEFPNVAKYIALVAARPAVAQGSQVLMDKLPPHIRAQLENPEK